MFVKDGIAYATQKVTEIKILSVKVVGELSLIVTFSNLEERIYDLTYLLKYPVYKKLKDFDFFNTVRVENGVLVWNDGEIDLAPNKVYEDSFTYERDII